MTDTPDGLAHIRTRAAAIAKLAETIKDERAQLRKDLSAADDTRTWGREELVTASRGGLSRALVLAHLGARDDLTTLRRALKDSGLDAMVGTTRDNDAWFELWADDDPEYRGDLEPGDEGDPDYDSAEYRTRSKSRRIGRLNALGAMLDALRKQGLGVIPDDVSSLESGERGTLHRLED